MLTSSLGDGDKFFKTHVHYDYCYWALFSLDDLFLKVLVVFNEATNSLGEVVRLPPFYISKYIKLFLYFSL
jgi:hypothetical protein